MVRYKTVSICVAYVESFWMVNNHKLVASVLEKNVPGMLGQILSILADRDINVMDMLNKSRGDIAYNLIDIEGGISDDALADIRAINHVIKVWTV